MPSPGDDLTFDDSSNLPAATLYLGDTSTQPAQSGSVARLSAFGNQSITIDSAALPGAGSSGRGGLALTQAASPACQSGDPSTCAIWVSMDPAARFELRDLPLTLAADIHVESGTFAVTRSDPNGGLQLDVPTILVASDSPETTAAQAGVVVSAAHGPYSLGPTTVRVHDFLAYNVDGTALTLQNDAVMDVRRLVVGAAPGSSPNASSTHIQIGDSPFSNTAVLHLETVAASGGGVERGEISLDAVGQAISMTVADTGEVIFDGLVPDQSILRISALDTVAGGHGSAELDVDGGLVEFRQGVLNPLIPYVLLSANTGGTSTLRVANGGVVRNTDIFGTADTGGIANVVVQDGTITLGRIGLEGGSLDVDHGTLDQVGLALGEPTFSPGTFGGASGSATIHNGSTLVGDGFDVDAIGGSSVSFDQSQGSDVRTTRVGGNPFGVALGVPASTLALDNASSYETSTLAIGHPAYAVHYDGTKDADALGAGDGNVTLAHGSSLVVGNRWNDPIGPGGSRPTLALGGGAGRPVGTLTLDATSSVVIADAGATTPVLGAVVVGSGGVLAGSGFINGDPLSPATPDVILRSGGDVLPGFSPGKLSIAGHYVQEGGTLTLEIGGSAAGSYDVLDAALGASFLGGTLRFERSAGYQGDVGAVLDFFAGRSVAFGLGLVIDDQTGLGLQLDLATGRATITQLAAPEPSVTALLAATLGLALGPRLARARGRRTVPTPAR